MTMKKIGRGGGTHPKLYYVDPPLRTLINDSIESRVYHESMDGIGYRWKIVNVLILTNFRFCWLISLKLQKKHSLLTYP